MSFDKLKQNRESALGKLIKAAEAVSSKKSYGDDREWKPVPDKAGNGYVVLRFLPAPDPEKPAWVRYWDHFFKGPTGRWYVENSRTTLGEDDPCSEMNTRLWNTGVESDKDTVRERKRKTNYVANVYIINDSNNPDNNGKVFLYKFGTKIFGKINDKLTPEFEDEVAMNPFDFWAGGDFKLKFRNVSGQRNYDLSSFDNPSEFLGGDEEKLREVYDKLHDIYEFTDPKNYKSYEDLKKKLIEVVGAEGVYGNVMAEVEQLNEPAPAYERPAPSVGKSTPAPEPAVATEADEDDDSLSYFAKLAQS
jgi:hypothetical protein